MLADVRIDETRREIATRLVARGMRPTTAAVVVGFYETVEEAER